MRRAPLSATNIATLLATAVFAFGTPAAANTKEPAVAPSPSGSRPVRQGFTLELGLGIAATLVSTTYEYEMATSGSGRFGSTSYTETESYLRFGYAPLSLSLGGFLNGH